MGNLLRTAFLHTIKTLFKLARPALFLGDAQTAHEHVMSLLRRLDQFPTVLPLVHKMAFGAYPVEIGGVKLDTRLMLAAGFVKGDGFASEANALAAVERGENIIPGWRSIPALVGAVEFGSFTRYPRAGNQGKVIWRDAATRSTQNRVGLKNPGAKAAALFLSQRPPPPVFGVNIAVSPGVSDAEQEKTEIMEAVQFFLDKNIHPAWFTLNLSCPNTEDDPGGHQTEGKTRELCGALVNQLRNIPLWVKISPTLTEMQYQILMRVFEEVGVRAVIATNTMPEPSPDNPQVMAGVGGGRLHTRAVKVAGLLAGEKLAHGYNVDVVGCGGVQDPPTYHDFALRGVSVVQYYSALIYQSPLAAAFIANDL